MGIPKKASQDEPDRTAPLVAASQWATRIIGVAIEMVVPALLGVWLDRQLGTLVLFTVLGIAAGMTTGLWQLLHMVRENGDDHSPTDSGNSQVPRNNRR